MFHVDILHHLVMIRELLPTFCLYRINFFQHKTPPNRNTNFQYSMTKTGLKDKHPTSNFQRRIMVRLRCFNFIKKTERSDTHIRCSMFSVRCSTFIFFLFVIWNFGHLSAYSRTFNSTFHSIKFRCNKIFKFFSEEPAVVPQIPFNTFPIVLQLLTVLNCVKNAIDFGKFSPL
jgi:hypothetical protein